MENIVLIGFMGSGKTTVGIRLSYRLRRSMEDTDKLIERREGVSISEIFAREGEEAFREKETELLRELAQSLHGKILSVGGGTPMREENRALLKQIGRVIYLRAKPETIYARLKNDTTRPLLQCEDPLLRIRGLMALREPIYEAAADSIVDVDCLESEEVLQAVEEACGTDGRQI